MLESGSALLGLAALTEFLGSERIVVGNSSLVFANGVVSIDFEARDARSHTVETYGRVCLKWKSFSHKKTELYLVNSSKMAAEICVNTLFATKV